MSSPEERFVYQLGIAVDSLKTQNANDHQQLRQEMVASNASVLKEVREHKKQWAVLAALVSFVGIALPVYSQIAQANATPHIVEVAKEASRQQMLEMQKARDKELSEVADEAARKAVRLVIVPQDTIRP